MPEGATIKPSPSVLQWARNESGYPVERVAKRLRVDPERISAWESGRRVPTVKQLERLARMYHRPTGLFFRSQPPALPPLAAEYRRLPGVTPGGESPELRLAIRQMSNRREAMLALLEELGEAIPRFALEAHVAEGAERVGDRLREALQVKLETQQAWGSGWQAWAYWRSAVEYLGVLVFQFPSVPLEEARGLSVLRSPLPVAAVNPKESSPEARSFTLLHEVVHLMLANGSEEQAAEREQRQGEAWLNVERFAEQAASHALIPEAAIHENIRARNLPRNDWDIGDVRKLAQSFRVSPLAMATRLRGSGVLSWPHYRSWKTAWESYTRSLKKRDGGFASPVDKTMGRAGRPFIRTVLEALATNRIGPAAAARHLELRFEHFEKLRSALIFQPGMKGDHD